MQHFATTAKIKISSSPHRDTVLFVVKKFVGEVHPVLHQLNKSIIHFDATRSNILVDDAHQFKSFIDFGNVIMTCTIFDLAVCLSSFMAYEARWSDGFVKFVGPIVNGYNSVLPLSCEEKSCLYYLVLARCCLVALIAEERCRHEPWNDYIHGMVEKNWRLFHNLLAFSKERVDEIWSKFI